MKRLRVSVAIVLAVIILSGCTASEVKFVTSLEKLSDAKYYEQAGHVSFEMSYYGGDEYFRDNMQKAKYAFDALKFDTTAIYDGSAKAGKAKTYMNAEAALDPVKVSGELWMDMDLENGKLGAIVKIPAMFKAFLPPEYMKDYLYLDYTQYYELLREGMGAPSISSFTGLVSLDLQNRQRNLIEVLMKSKSLSGNYVVSSKTDGGLEKLTFKMTDAQLKSFVIAFLKEIKENGELLGKLAEMTEYNIALMGAAGYSGADEFDAKKTILESVDEILPEAEAFFANNTILGSKGLTSEMTLDKNGYVSNEEFVVNFRINTGGSQIMPFYYMDTDSGTVDFTMTVTTEYTNVNGTGRVELPRLTPANSVNIVNAEKERMTREGEERKWYFPLMVYYSDALDELNETPVDFPLTGTYNGNAVDSSVSVMRAGYGSLYMPLRQAAEVFGGEIEWNEEQRAALWTNNGNVLVVFADGVMEYESFYDIYGEDAGYITGGVIKDGVTFIPFNEMEYQMDIDFGFDTETNTILVR